MADIIEMKRRGGATGARSKAANAQRRQRDQQLLGLLEAVERHLLRDRQVIAALRAKQAAAARDIEQLRTLLQVMLALAEQGTARKPGLCHDELERLVRRLCDLAASANRDL